jgi:hypothetical protein
VSLQQKDPVNNFCRRFGHQTAVVDQKLFIDGGLVDWNPITSYPQNYTSKSAISSFALVCLGRAPSRRTGTPGAIAYCSTAPTAHANTRICR